MQGTAVGNEFRNDYDIVIDSFREIDIRALTEIPMITIYNKPVDYPGKYVARLIGFKDGAPLIFRHIVIKEKLEDLRNSIPDGMVKLRPSENDDPKIVEIYI